MPLNLLLYHHLLHLHRRTGISEGKERSESALAPLLEEEALLLNQLEEGLLVGSGEVALISSNRCW